MQIRISWYVITIVIIAALLCPVATGGSQSRSSETDAHIPGQNYQIKHGKTLLTITSRRPQPGDEIFFPDGRHYRINGCRGNTAWVKPLGTDAALLQLSSFYDNLPAVMVQTGNWPSRPIAIYHTHTAESYIPSDGKASIPFNGGIYQVGETFKNKLEQNGVIPKYNETPHDPHDKNAYYRSRRTAFKLLKEQPAAMFDIHRDGVDDPDFYTGEVWGKEVSQIRLIVGRQNPKMEANLEFAKRMMTYTNKQYPDLVKDIYLARGNYNQDLLSTALLIEAGTYTNKKETAQDGIALFANAVPAVLGIGKPEAQEQPQTGTQTTGRAPWKTAVFLIFLTALGTVGFIAINAGPVELDKFTRRLTSRVPAAKIYARLEPGITAGHREFLRLREKLLRLADSASRKARQSYKAKVDLIKQYLAQRKRKVR